MTVIQFPKRPTGTVSGPRTIYVCAPSFDDMDVPKKKFGLGYSREAARAAFYGGDPASQEIDAKVYTLASTYAALKHQIVSQLQVFLANNQPLSPIEEDVSQRLGNNAYLYSAHGARPKKRKRLDKLFG